MMSGMCDSPHHYPRARSSCIKKTCFGLPPGYVLRAQHCQALPTVLGVALHEFQPSLRCRKRRRIDVNSKNVDEPQIFADALVHHLFVHAASSWVTRAWAL